MPQSCAFAFAAGSDLSVEDRLFVAFVVDVGQSELTFASLLGAQHDACTVALTRVRQDEVRALAGDSCIQLDSEQITTRCFRCTHLSEHLPQREAVSRFVESVPGLVVASAGIDVGDSASLLRCIEALPGLASQSVLHSGNLQSSIGATRGVVCKDAKYSTGPKVWPAAVELCKCLASEPWKQRLRGASVLELGCGLGLPGIVSAFYLGAQRVILTDSGADVEAVVDAALKTILSSGLPSEVLSFAPLAWGSAQAEAFLAENISLHGVGFDVILCGDCVYEPYFGEESWKLLAETLAVLLLPPSENGSQAVVSSSGKAGFYRWPVAVLSVEKRIEGIDGVDSFLEALVTHGLCMRRVSPEVALSEADPKNDVEVLIVRHMRCPEGIG
eukprot:TRINITY_DN45985_c0_g1_i1.p1 TRINITY_DN45985_c0_g1~~TRINITY_DN45985_c0_g1_i1.p1  ORF type:complete len:387 (+),score=66.82 TRINITY_DN45985_c0_g1_i1:89-1249(+)